MFSDRPPLQSQRMDLAPSLLAAVAEGDPILVHRLVDQRDHRHGLAALKLLMQGPSLLIQGGNPAPVAFIPPLPQRGLSPTTPRIGLPSPPTPASLLRFRSWLADADQPGESALVLRSVPRTS